jgi:hypothetical protein
VWQVVEHPNIVPFLGMMMDWEVPSLKSQHRYPICLVSLWMANGSIAEYVRENSDLAVTRRLRFVITSS